MYNSHWKPKWEVIDFEKILTYPAKDRAGLQLSDCVASSFYSALEFTGQNIVKPQFAQVLMPRMARSNRNKIYGFGIKVLPNYAPTIVKEEQRQFFECYIHK